MLTLVNLNNQPAERRSTLRMLAAVMFADIASYTAIMQEDERYAIQLRRRQRRILEDKLPNYGGEIRQYYGDGALCIFRSAVEAVCCAADLQREFGREPRVPVRIGIHMGDILSDPEGIYGDAVNIAARIETMATPGRIYISGKVRREIDNQRSLASVSVGTFTLKNVRQPVELYMITDTRPAVPGDNGITQGKYSHTTVQECNVNRSQYGGPQQIDPLN